MFQQARRTKNSCKSFEQGQHKWSKRSNKSRDFDSFISIE